MKSRVIQNPTDRSMSASVARRTVVGFPDAAERPRRGNAVSSLIRRHPMAVFLGLAFALTWVTVPIGAFMAAGPLIAALVVIGVTEGRTGLRELGSRMIKWRVGWKWYAAALLIPLGLVLAMGALNVAFGAPDAAFAKLQLSTLAFTFGLRLVIPMFAPIGEEPGWRGFALPRLQAHRSPLPGHDDPRSDRGGLARAARLPVGGALRADLPGCHVARAPSSTRGCSTTRAGASS